MFIRRLPRRNRRIKIKSIKKKNTYKIYMYFSFIKLIYEVKHHSALNFDKNVYITRQKHHKIPEAYINTLRILVVLLTK